MPEDTTTTPAMPEVTSTQTPPPAATSPTTPAPTPEATPASTDSGKSLLGKALESKGAPAGAPEKYESFRLPEGYELDAALGEAAMAAFKEQGLSQAQAQRMIDLYAESNMQAAEAPYKLWADLQKEWTAEVQKEFGRDIEPGGRVISSISRLIDSMPAPMAQGFREAMDLTGVGSHPAFVRAFAHLADKLGEGVPVRGNGPSELGQRGPQAVPKSIAEIMYPNNPSATRG